MATSSTDERTQVELHVQKVPPEQPPPYYAEYSHEPQRLPYLEYQHESQQPPYLEYSHESQYQQPSDYYAPPTYHNVVAQEVINYGPDCQTIICIHCHQQIITQVKSEPTSDTHIYSCVMFLFLCPFSWMPYCLNSCKTLNHYCPNCNAYLGSYGK